MSDYAQNFIAYLQGLKEDKKEKKSGALAHLRRSLGFEPGCYTPAFPYVERFVAEDKHSQDASRQALYLVAGLFALHPKQGSKSLAAAFGALMRERDSASIEQRFIALLGADTQNLPDYLRQTISLLRADERALDYAALLDDMSRWLNPRIDPKWRDEIRRDWARDFYRAVTEASPATDAASESVSTSIE
ncbi:MAG: type I-E CRISPR-associated protein Cse2/CasB [Pseudomonadales bacterium]|jgi:CRISPR system Cascade subunit CasB|nr:type I-E CRISPR-associated protein Cse2/CasB [Pseudomonadales bacterium]